MGAGAAGLIPEVHEQPGTAPVSVALCPTGFGREARPSLQPRADRHLFLDIQALRGLTEHSGRLTGGLGALVDAPL